MRDEHTNQQQQEKKIVYTDEQKFYFGFVVKFLTYPISQTLHGVAKVFFFFTRVQSSV